jgi:hypothetical protein
VTAKAVRIENRKTAQKKGTETNAFSVVPKTAINDAFGHLTETNECCH